MRLVLPAWPQSTHMLAAATVLLGALAIYPWLAPAPAPSGSTGTAQPPQTVPAIGPLPPLARFAAVFGRPLFSPSRRPVPTEQSPAAGNGVVGRYQLLGVVSAGGMWRALMADGNRRFEILEGATLDGWRVSRIEQDRLTLSSPGGQMVVKLRRAGEAPAEPPAPAAPAR